MSNLSHRIDFSIKPNRFKQIFYKRAQPAIKCMVVFFISLLLIGGGVSAPTAPNSLFAVENLTQDERRALEEELEEVEEQIDEYQSTIEGLQSQANTLQNELKRLDAQVAQINLRIKATSLTLEKLNQDIKETQNQIFITEGEIQFKKNALARSIRVINQEESVSMVEILLRNPKFSDFFSELKSLLILQDSTRQALEEVKILKTNLIDQQETLALERVDVVALKEFNESQKLELNKARNQKDTLLQITKGEESRYQDMLEVSIEIAAEIRNRIFQLLGGGELTFERALDLAKFAEGATGVRAALILAVLDRESRLGKNVGRCPYYDPETNKYYMHPKRDVPKFLEILNELDIAPESVMVSCPNSDGTYGGAMGPAQFIPSTWDIYKDKIALVGGNNPPSPWNNTDAFLATAIFMSDLGAAGGTISDEREAAARYYAGRRWRTYLWTYGDWVVSKANSYQDDIDILAN